MSDQLIDAALNALQLARVTYGDIRLIHARTESIAVKNAAPEAVTTDASAGFGVRALVNGAWGFAASSRLEPDEVQRVVALAVDIAQAAATIDHPPVTLDDQPPVQATYNTPQQTDPFTVPLETKLALLTESSALLQKAPAIRLAQAFFAARDERKTFANTAGSRITQHLAFCGAGIAATALEDQQLHVRSYPNSFRGNFATAGYEFVQHLDLPHHAPRVADEACQLLTAPPCPTKTTTLILDGSQLALQVHESIGHAVELDRVLGSEASYAGDSFLAPDHLENLQYGSEIVNVVADATCPAGLGTFAYDDEGVPAQATPIIQAGRFTGFLSGRETAPHIRRSSSGAMRASGWDRIPLVRMTNVNLLPGSWSLDDLIADTDDGVYMCTNRSWSIDNKRINFQFGTEIAYEVCHGRLGRILRNPTYTGRTLDFWRSCDAITNQDHWALWGTPNCGKGEPGQTMHVGHGVAPARFRNVDVGVYQG